MLIQENEEFIVVKAHKIDEKYIYYKCPYCFKINNGRVLDSPYCKKTKRTYKTAVQNTHKHGSGGDLFGRIEQRVSHCKINHKKEVKIIIDETTIGCLKEK